MKKNILLKGAYLFLISLFSCTSEFEHVNSEAIDDIIMQTTGLRAESSSRTYPSINNGYVDILWSENDVVGVFPNEGSQAAFPMNSAAGTTQASFNGGGWALKASYKYAAYYPYEFNNRDYTKIPVSYLGQKQIGKNTSTHTGPYNYMVASANTPSEGKVNFTFQNMGCMVIMDLTVPEPTTLNTVVLSVDGAKFTTKGEINIMEATPTITPTTYSSELRIDLENVTTTSTNEVVTVYFMTAPVNLYGKTINVHVYDNQGNSQGTSIAGKNLEAGGFYSLVGTLPGNQDINNVFKLNQAGQLSTMINAAQKNIIKEMKIIGDLNGDDIRFIREMAGRDISGNKTEGKLIKLDIKDTRIVEGGGYYYNVYKTVDNTIGESMFKETNLIEIELPTNIIEIGGWAFDECESLNVIEIPNAITKIGEYAFYNCSKIESITIPNNVNTIEESTFSGCSSLTEISIPNGVTHINDNAFFNCYSIKSISLPNSLTNIGNDAFSMCGKLGEIIIPNSVVEIGRGAFNFCSNLTVISIPNGVTQLSQSIFAQCTNLSKVIIPNSVTIIKDFAFFSCHSLKEIILPTNIENIGKSAFSCSALENIVIPEGVTVITNSSFSTCNDLKSVQLPSTLNTISVSAFELCSNLSEIRCNAKTHPDVENENAFKSVDKTTCKIYVPEGSLADYKNADYWKDFLNITEMK